MSLARYYVYITLFEPVLLSWTSLYIFTFLLFITYLGLISKFIINTIHIIITACYIKQPSLLVVDPIDPSDIPSPDTSSNKKTHFSLVSNHNHYHLPPHLPRVSSWVKGGVICTAIGTVIGCGALYYYRDTAISSRISADAAVRSADAAEVSAGLMTEEEFRNKWKKR